MNNAPITNEFQTPPPLRKPPYIVSRHDFWLAVATWIVGYLYVSAIPAWRHPWLTLGVQALLLVGTLIYLRRTEGHMTPWIGILTGVGVALSLSALWSVNRALLSAVAVWNALAWFYLVFLLTGNSRERRPGAYFAGEMLSAVQLPFDAPVTAFGALFGAKKAPDGTPLPKSRLRSTVGWICLGLLLAIVPTVIVALLLSYDEGFSAVMESILDKVFSATTLFRQLRNIAIGLLVGAILFAAILAARTRATRARKVKEAEAAASAADYALPEGIPAPAPTTRRDGAHLIPVPLVAAMLTPIMTVYAIFFFSQWDYYVSAFTGVRPEELTFADYAREGFFQLVVVAVINAVLCLGAAGLSRRRAYDPDRPKRERTHPVIRIYLAVLALMTLVLIATALSKMFLYVDTYGMSHKRVYATWLMVLLAVAFVALILRQLMTRMNLTGTLVATFLAFFLAIALIPVDALIVRYNVDAALDGNLRTMQGDVCDDSRAAGVLAALDFMEATEGSPDGHAPEKLTAVRAATDDYLWRMAEDLADLDWYEHNITTLRAKAALEREGYEVLSEEDAE